MTSDREAALMRVVEAARALDDNVRKAKENCYSYDIRQCGLWDNVVKAISALSAPVAAEQPARESAEAVAAPDELGTAEAKCVSLWGHDLDAGITIRAAAREMYVRDVAWRKYINADRAAHDAMVAELERELADAKAGNDYKGWTEERDRLNATIASQAAEIEKWMQQAHGASARAHTLAGEVADLESKLAAAGKGVDARAKFFNLVAAELDHAYAKHGKPQWGKHEFYAVVLEEVDELWDAIKGDEPMDQVLREAVQVAAMCFRYAETGDRYRGEHDIDAAARKPKALHAALEAPR